MDSTPDQPVTPPEEPDDGSAASPEQVVPPADATPPGAASIPGVSGAQGAPPPPPPGFPPIEQAPANPYAADSPVPPPGQPGQPGPWQQPAQPGQWQQSAPGQPPQPGPMGYAPGAWTPPTPARKGLSFGARLGIGLGIGVVAHVLGVGLMFASLEPLNGFGGVFGLLWPFVLIALAAGVMMFFRATRPFATGILIIAAAMWLVVIGPCVLLITSLGG